MAHPRRENHSTNLSSSVFASFKSEGAFGANDFTISFSTNVPSNTPEYFVDIGHSSNIFLGQDEGGGADSFLR